MGFIVSFLQSIVYQNLIIKFENKYNLFSDSSTKAHAIHKIPTPRVGGIGIFFAFALTTLQMMQEYWWIVVGGAIIFGFGLIEDWHGNTRKEFRLAAMSIGTYVTIYFGGYIADNSEFFVLPYSIAVIFTIFAVVGLSSAINFIDGLNGLASGVSIITLIFFISLSCIYDDTVVSALSMIIMGGTFGFFILNYPSGKIFLGDGGAYFLGFILAIISIMLAARHSEISLWYPLVALSYPVIETFVTIDRRIKRKKKHGTSFFEAEKVHLHTLKFCRKIRNNYQTTNRLLFFHFLINVTAFAFHQNVFALMVVFVIVYLLYLKKYRELIRFKTV